MPHNDPAVRADARSKTGAAPAVAGIFEHEVLPEQGGGTIRFVVNPRVYPLDLIYQAAFLFIDRYYVFLDRDGEGRCHVVLTGKEPLSPAELNAAMGEFANELLAQAVRKLVGKQNGRLREMVVAKALWGTGAVDIDKGLAYAAKGDDQKLRARLDDEARREQEELDRLLAEIEKDFSEDPLGIATPWEDRFGKKAGGAEAPAKPTESEPVR